jgi:hypothetical protein
MEIISGKGASEAEQRQKNVDLLPEIKGGKNG